MDLDVTEHITVSYSVRTYKNTYYLKIVTKGTDYTVVGMLSSKHAVSYCQ